MLLFVRCGLETAQHRQGQSELFHALFITRPVLLCVSSGLDRCTLMYCGTARLVPPLQSAHGILSHLALCISIDRHPNTTTATPFCKLIEKRAEQLYMRTYFYQTYLQF